MAKATISNMADESAPPSFKPTGEQEQALAYFQTGKSLAIQAGAGTGKTATLAMMARATKRSGQYLAFNKKLVEDSAGRFPSNVGCRTAHSLAFRGMRDLKKYQGMDIMKRCNADVASVTVSTYCRRSFGCDPA